MPLFSKALHHRQTRDQEVERDLDRGPQHSQYEQMVIVVLDSLDVVNTMRQRLTIGTADLDVACLLRVPVNSAVGIMRRVITDFNDVAIYVGEAVYRGDMVRLEREIKRG
jgi:GntR family transcriptional regulator